MSVRGTGSGPPEATAGALLSPALGPAAGAPIATATLGDRRRVAVVLQGAALLAHLRRAGWRLQADLATGSIHEGELLCGLVAAPGAADDARAQLRCLLGALFGPGELAGRGDGRRAARELCARWAGELLRLVPDQAVEEIFAVAPFLWEPRFGAARAALAAGWRVGGATEPWLAGSEGARRRLLALAPDGEALAGLLGGPTARDLWEGEEPGSGRGLETTGRGGAAAPPARAEAAAAAGRYRTALELLEGDVSVEGRLLAGRCAFELGRDGSARRTVAQLRDQTLSAAHRLELAELALRLELASPAPQGVGDWLAVAREAAGGPLAWRAELLAAEAAAALGNAAELAERLEAARGALGDSALAWRWHRLRAQLAAPRSDRGVPAEALAPLRQHRLALGAPEVALLWDDLAAARLAAGDLRGAERAAAHAARLLRAGEATRLERQVLRRLVEARLRRGRMAGVREALERLALDDRLDRQAPALAADAALLARLELVRGRSRSALARCEAALAEQPLGGPAVAELRVLAARALGWLGRADEARRLLAGAEAAAAAPRVLEAEEQPALWAHAGERERALAAAGEAPCRPLWEAVLAAAHPARGRWAELEGLEAHRAARLVFDFERLTPGLVPVPSVRRAIAELRRLSADELAAQLESRLTGPWEALSAHLAESTHDEDGLQRLFASAGAEQVWLAVCGPRGEEVLLPGPGGPEELVAPLGDGHLVLRAPRLDAVVKSFFRLMLRQLPAVRAAAAGQPVPGIVGESPALLSALARLPRLAGGDLPILVLGESGTGKEVVARQVHRLSRRATSVFLPINCAALSESLLLSDLFGHTRGAFTGADRDHAGIFESARGGTVFLDEIGDLPLAAQGKLLRVLQEKEVRRLGESAPRKVDVRVVTATHRDLAAMVRERSFREDLFYRLRVAVVELPPLRDRGNDVLLLAEHFLVRGSRGRRPPRLSKAARARLAGHHWPGNVRELENVLEVAAALADGGTIEADHLQLVAEERRETTGTYHQQLESFRRRLVEDALVEAGGSRAEAARKLGLTRQALSYLVKQLRIDTSG